MIKNFLMYLFIPLLLFQAIGCKTTDTGSTNHLFDPKVPGGIIGGGFTVAPVTELVANTSVLGQITLTWNIESLYYPLPYHIKIYRKKGSTSFVLPDPSQSYNAADLYKLVDISKDSCPIETSADPVNGIPFVHNTSNIPGNCNTFVDTTNIYADTQYHYWAYLYLNTSYSAVADLTVQTTTTGAALNVPTAETFWNNKKWSMGGNPYSNGVGSARYLNFESMEPRNEACQLQVSQPTCSQVVGCSWSLNSTTSSFSCVNESSFGHMKGKTAFALDGAIMYVADTDNNRVQVFTRAEALACAQYKADTNQAVFQACMFSAQGFPFTPKNILGQPTQTSNAPCNVSCQSKTTSSACGAIDGCTWDITASSCSATFSYDKCLTKPSYVSVSGNQLIISDSGNNRLVVWNHLPADPSFVVPGGSVGSSAGGCDPNIISRQNYLADCTPSYQIGKKSFQDFSNYQIASDGNQTFNNPTGTLVNGNDLYVADTGNNRVIKIKDYKDDNVFNCDAANWGGSFCRFSGVLGQASFFVKRTFQDFFDEDLQKQISCSSLSYPAATGPGGTKISCQASTVGCTWTSGQLLNQGTCTLSSPLLSATGIGNIIGTPYSYVLQRYFSNPTVVKIASGRLLVSSNENFRTVSIINTDILLKGRILEWKNNPLDGDVPTCNPINFNSGGCDASIVFGQADFKTLVSVQGTTGKYTDVSYGLQSLDDFDIQGKTMIGVDSINNFVYLWKDWTDNALAGNAPSGTAQSPIAGAVYNGQTLPVLKGLGAVTIVPETLLIYVTDASGNNVYEVKAY